MEAYGRILLIAMPSFLLLVLFEKWYGWRKGIDTVRGSDMISSLSSGMTNVTKDVLGLSFAVISYSWLVDHLSLTHIESGWAAYAIAFVALDFSGYWIHRIAHEYNLFWNNHIIHHSSEEFNLACALRQSISTYFRIFTFFLIPAALLGIPERVIAIVAPLHLFAQFWYHTQHIGKMGFLEKIIVTPSHHRVHHAINPIYLDKNYSQIFIIWDKFFGTFQEELIEVTPVYGVTRPVRTWNPIKINFMHLWLLIKDAWRAKKSIDKLKIWFMPLGWRPDDVAEKFPVYKITDVYNFQKYNPQISQGLLAWTWFQMMMALLFISYFFYNMAAIGSPNIFIYGGFVILTVYAYTDLLDRNFYAFVWEGIRCALGMYIIYDLGDWFGLGKSFVMANQLLVVYFICSISVTFWFALKHKQEDNQEKAIVG